MILLDTHALIWWISGLQPLSARARRAVNEALGVPVAQWLQDLRALPDLLIEPVSAEIAQLAGTIGEALHGDPGDRIIVATQPAGSTEPPPA